MSATYTTRGAGTIEISLKATFPLDDIFYDGNISFMETTMDHPLRAARKRRDMTLEQLSALSGLHKGTISKIENRVQGASIDAYRRLGNALDVDWRALVED